jgi:hypothetical protein
VEDFKVKKGKKRKAPDDFEQEFNAEFNREKVRVQGRDATGAYRKKLLGKTTQEHRDLDRAAFLLAQLKQSRVCAAVGVEDRDDGETTEKHLQLFANVPDAQMEPDMREIVQATRDPKARKKILKRLKATPDGCRLKKTPENAQKREAARKKRDALLQRRLDKSLRGLSKQGVAAPRVHAPIPYAPKPIHAEQQATQWAKDQKVTFTDMGISKLCCAKCWKSLEAAKSIHPNFATGTHMKSYETDNGWPAPAFLFGDDAVLKAFLGDQAFALFSACDAACKAKCKELVETQALSVKGQRETDLVSSEEEFEFEDFGDDDL